MKRITAGFLFLCFMALCLAGCGGKAEFDAKTYVKGVLDTAYKGEYSDYTAQTGVKKGDAEAAHKEFLKESAVRLAAYCGLKEDEMDAEKFEGLCEKLFQAIDYEITDVKETGDGYTVKVETLSASGPLELTIMGLEACEDYQKGLAEGKDRKELVKAYQEALVPFLEEAFEEMPGLVESVNARWEAEVVVEKDGENGYSITSESLADVQETMLGF